MAELTRTLPASWYCNKSLYQMERRAVFLKVRSIPRLRSRYRYTQISSQSWYLLGPVTRFQNVGEHVEYEIAQQPIYAVRTSGDALNPTAEELKVFCAKSVCYGYLSSY